MSERPKPQAWPGYRWPHLINLTDRLVREDRWPQTDRWLALQFREHKAFGRKDRRFYSDAIFRLCREAAALVWLQARFKDEVLDWQRDAVWARLQTIPPAELWSWLVLLDGADDQLPRELTDAAERRRCLDALSDDEQAQLNPLRQGWVPPLKARLERRIQTSDWSADTLHHWQQLQQRRPPLWLRLVPGHEREALESLTGNGLTPIEQDGLAVAIDGDSRLTDIDAWRNGWLDIQDRGSQRIVEAVNARPGERIWDLCAGAGGKALALASLVGPDGHILATDIRDHALDKTVQRAKRLGLPQLETRTLDATDPEQIHPLNGLDFDAILIDAPCTASGTWRRSPDARWRLDEDSLRAFTDLQDRLLAQATGALAPGGRLVYATCSWLVEENEDRVSAFLAQHSDFKLVSQRIVGAPEDDADTLFVAVMNRR
ncbi:RsmB/NOP family class I SAM-dependent RNA methyltransferase [Saccharospirillum salsuginis]|uniref:rRNA cytosine-C5-methylase n=1 Tax=Saccharospirillum salsuginis TaxID=418750 RepID=A0A918KRS9_9GAMM|nr:RsmB/NOP family class I SAM-dependent RNA methyltransferase [Saccharospirillum salsuginis]GGX73430.1 rRNA cytosine-C5-methylase [Saccharospirillum salsuginis]